MAAAAKMMCSGWHLQMWEFRLITWVNTRETETVGCWGITNAGLQIDLLSLSGATSDNSRTWNCIFHSALISSCIWRWYRHRRLHDAFYPMVDIKAVFFVPSTEATTGSESLAEEGWCPKSDGPETRCRVQQRRHEQGQGHHCTDEQQVAAVQVQVRRCGFLS